MDSEPQRSPSRRAQLTRVGAVFGGAAACRLMTSLGFAAPSTYRGPIRLEGVPRGASVLILGAGLGVFEAPSGFGSAICSVWR
jgi:monoamine oxidase